MESEQTLIAQQLSSIRATLPPQVVLVAVSKTKPISAIQQAYAAGQRRFGENKVQEMLEKHEALPPDIEWHFIGHLQTNKVKYIAPFVSMIHAVDSLKLAQEINKQAAKNKRKIRCLLQFHIAQESSKFGLTLDEAVHIIDHSTDFDHLEIVGVMGMATFTTDTTQVRTEFRSLKTLFNTLKATHFSNTPSFTEISMGMSDDYRIAIEEGSTIVRIGSTLFGTR